MRGRDAAGARAARLALPRPVRRAARRQRRASSTASIAWDEVSADEGTGIVHIAPGCGKEDFALGKEHGSAVDRAARRDGVYVDGFDWLTGRHVGEVARPIVDNLREKGCSTGPSSITHRYPHCWRCGTELLFRLVDEWFIGMDELREHDDGRRRSRSAGSPSFGLERELDWLRNMDDWMISKKRYWGLALPIWDCDDVRRTSR